MNDAAGLGLGGIQKRAGLTLEKPKYQVGCKSDKKRRNSERDQRCF